MPGIVTNGASLLIATIVAMAGVVAAHRSRRAVKSIVVVTAALMLPLAALAVRAVVQGGPEVASLWLLLPQVHVVWDMSQVAAVGCSCICLAFGALALGDWTTARTVLPLFVGGIGGILAWCTGNFVCMLAALILVNGSFMLQERPKLQLSWGIAVLPIAILALANITLLSSFGTSDYFLIGSNAGGYWVGFGLPLAGYLECVLPAVVAWKSGTLQRGIWTAVVGAALLAHTAEVIGLQQLQSGPIAAATIVSCTTIMLGILGYHWRESGRHALLALYAAVSGPAVISLYFSDEATILVMILCTAVSLLVICTVVPDVRFLEANRYRWTGWLHRAILLGAAGVPPGAAAIGWWSILALLIARGPTWTAASILALAAWLSVIALAVVLARGFSPLRSDATQSRSPCLRERMAAILGIIVLFGTGLIPAVPVGGVLSLLASANLVVASSTTLQLPGGVVGSAALGSAVIVLVLFGWALGTLSGTVVYQDVELPATHETLPIGLHAGQTIRGLGALGWHMWRRGVHYLNAGDLLLRDQPRLAMILVGAAIIIVLVH